MTLQRFSGTLFARRSDFAEGFSEKVREIDRWELVADRFDSFQGASSTDADARIPKRIHQIWLGGRLPARYRTWAESWKDVNPGWEYLLWDDKSVRNFGLRNEKAYQRSSNLGAKSDIARYEILERLGGVYADTDFECLRPLDDLARRCSFFAGVVFGYFPQIANGLMGSAPRHPLLRRVIEGLEKPVTTRDGMATISQTGADYLTACFFERARDLPPSDVIFPSTYFYPLPNFVQVENGTAKQRYAREWSLAIHYWETSWLKPHPLRALLGKARRRIMHGANAL